MFSNNIFCSTCLLLINKINLKLFYLWTVPLPTHNGLDRLFWAYTMYVFSWLVPTHTYIIFITLTGLRRNYQSFAVPFFRVRVRRPQPLRCTVVGLWRQHGLRRRIRRIAAPMPQHHLSVRPVPLSGQHVHSRVPPLFRYSRLRRR